MDSRQGLLTGVVGTLMLVAGCMESGTEPESDLTADTNGEIFKPPADEAQQAPSTTPDVDASSIPAWQAYPVDLNADDSSAMIITGLDELASSQALSPWLVSVRTFRRAPETGTLVPGDAVIELTQYVENFPVSAHIRFFSEPLDTCLIRNDQSEQGVDPANLPPPGISGGENVTFNTPSGPWFSLDQHRIADAQRVYRAEDLVPGALPVGTSLSIPGDAFPTVSAYPLFEPEPVVRLLPDASQPVTTESRFSWIPFDQPGHVKIDFMIYGKTDDFQGFPASCWVVDDGSFDLPGEVLQALEPFELQTASVSRLAVRYTRIYSRLDLIDGIVFHQRMEVAE